MNLRHLAAFVVVLQSHSSFAQNWLISLEQTPYLRQNLSTLSQKFRPVALALKRTAEQWCCTDDAVLKFDAISMDLRRAITEILRASGPRMIFSAIPSLWQERALPEEREIVFDSESAEKKIWPIEGHPSQNGKS